MTVSGELVKFLMIVNYCFVIFVMRVVMCRILVRNGYSKADSRKVIRNMAMGGVVPNSILPWALYSVPGLWSGMLLVFGVIFLDQSVLLLYISNFVFFLVALTLYSLVIGFSYYLKVEASFRSVLSSIDRDSALSYLLDIIQFKLDVSPRIMALYLSCIFLAFVMCAIGVFLFVSLGGYLM